MKARGVGVDHAVDDYEAVKEKLGADVDTSGSRFNDAFRIARAENQRQDMILLDSCPLCVSRETTFRRFSHSVLGPHIRQVSNIH